MLTILGFGMVATFMVLIMTKRLSPVVALIAIPVLFALMLDGIRTLAPTGVMLMFAILYFGIMIDAGLFDPIVRCILRLVGSDPLKVVMGTAVLAALISLDGDGSTTYMMVCAAMLPLYRRLKLDALNLTCVTMLASGVMNLTPWGGPNPPGAAADVYSMIAGSFPDRIGNQSSPGDVITAKKGVSQVESKWGTPNWKQKVSTVLPLKDESGAYLPAAIIIAFKTSPEDKRIDTDFLAPGLAIRDGLQSRITGMDSLFAPAN
jgi:Citrate transporter